MTDWNNAGVENMKHTMWKRKTNVEKVIEADVLQVARNHLHPDKLQILAVSYPDDFDESLSVLGSANEIDITIPPPRQQLIIYIQ